MTAHGVDSTYQRGKFRCEACVEVHNARVRADRKRRLNSGSLSPGHVPHMTILSALAGPIFAIALAVLAVSMFMSPLHPPYGVVDALLSGVR